jgi:vesicle coat complex subunit
MIETLSLMTLDLDSNVCLNAVLALKEIKKQDFNIQKYRFIIIVLFMTDNCFLFR